MSAKTEKVVTNLEPEILNILEREMAAEQLSASAYMRRLLIEHLKERGLLTEQTLMRIVR